MPARASSSRGITAREGGRGRVPAGRRAEVLLAAGHGGAQGALAGHVGVADPVPHQLGGLGIARPHQHVGHEAHGQAQQEEQGDQAEKDGEHAHGRDFPRIVPGPQPRQRASRAGASRAARWARSARRAAPRTRSPDGSACCWRSCSSTLRGPARHAGDREHRRVKEVVWWGCPARYRASRIEVHVGIEAFWLRTSPPPPPSRRTSGARPRPRHLARELPKVVARGSSVR